MSASAACIFLGARLDAPDTSKKCTPWCVGRMCDANEGYYVRLHLSGWHSPAQIQLSIDGQMRPDGQWMLPDRGLTPSVQSVCRDGGASLDQNLIATRDALSDGVYRAGLSSQCPARSSCLGVEEADVGSIEVGRPSYAPIPHTQ